MGVGIHKKTHHTYLGKILNNIQLNYTAAQINYENTPKNIYAYHSTNFRNDLFNKKHSLDVQLSQKNSLDNS